MNQGHSMLPTAEAQVGRLEQFHEVLDYGLDVYNPIDKPSNLYITDQSETARALADVTTLLDEIVPQRRLVISRRQETSQGVIRRIPNKKTPVIESCINLTEDDFRGYKVDPDMRVVLDLNREMAVRVLTGRRLHEHVGGITVHDHYLKYLRELKRRLSASEILQFRRQQVVREQRRADSITGAVSEALSLCRKARLVRVDGSYKQSVRRNKTPECISNDLDRFIRNMRHNKRQFSALVLAVFKIEYGAKKGYHWHGYFIFDGSKVRMDVLLGTYLKSYWCDVVTKGEGAGFNVNVGEVRTTLSKRLQVPDRHLAIGEFRKGDAIQEANMKALIRYFAKKEQSLRLTGQKSVNQLRIVRGPRFKALKQRRDRTATRESG
ncbi:hypothetical protein [Alcanivorax jadensis]|uniref:hypothetical protein n=1 Tax=Alcanivorax jadensis TaxID=64988 RepID=UPI00356309DF